MLSRSVLLRVLAVCKKYSRFIGPGLMVSVAYMDPGNYSTAVAAGSAYKYSLLFLILLSNCLAIFLQILAARLGAVTGLDLAANCRAHFSYKVNMFIYVLTEVAIIATDLAEVVGTAIALNILFNMPLILGVVLTVVDVIIVLMAYRPKGPLLFIRIFELFVSILVAATVVCFGIELYQVANDSTILFSVSEVLRGFLPSKDVVDMSDRKGGNGLFLSLAILGATVMPHSLYLGSGLVQARLKDFDLKNGHYHRRKPCKPRPEHQVGCSHDDTLVNIIPDNMASDNTSNTNDFAQADITPVATPYTPNQFEKLDDDDASTLGEDDDSTYRPSVHAISNTMSYTIVELVISLFTVALFVNSAILIVAGATLTKGNVKYDDTDGTDSDSDAESFENADLFTIYHLLSEHLSPTAGFVFALALLCSGQSAGVVCTLAGQMVSEGFLSWSFPPVVRRLITRGMAIAPCLLVVSFTGREGLSTILNASQVVLSVLLPVVSAPLIYFTCSKETMRVPIFATDSDDIVDTIDNEPFDTLDTAKFRSTEPAIRLQDLRNTHPCAGWEDDDEHVNHGVAGDNRLQNQERRQGYHESRLLGQGYQERNQEESLLRDDDQERLLLSAEVFDDPDNNCVRIKGYKDYSNGPVTTFVAILIWGFITALNLYLIGSMALGYDVPL